jgi:hypothetical protein
MRSYHDITPNYLVDSTNTSCILMAIDYSLGEEFEVPSAVRSAVRSAVLFAARMQLNSPLTVSLAEPHPPRD